MGMVHHGVLYVSVREGEHGAQLLRDTQVRQLPLSRIRVSDVCFRVLEAPNRLVDDALTCKRSIAFQAVHVVLTLGAAEHSAQLVIHSSSHVK